MRVLLQRSIISVAWCPQDSDLLLTAAKDSPMLCWNHNFSQTGKVSEVNSLFTDVQWKDHMCWYLYLDRLCMNYHLLLNGALMFSDWCLRNPNIISVTSFDCHICVYSLLGGGAEEPTQSAQVWWVYIWICMPTPSICITYLDICRSWPQWSILWNQFTVLTDLDQYYSIKGST